MPTYVKPWITTTEKQKITILFNVEISTWKLSIDICRDHLTIKKVVKKKLEAKEKA